jgi:hypothetical protein
MHERRKLNVTLRFQDLPGEAWSFDVDVQKQEAYPAEAVRALVEAAEGLLDNMIDSGAYGPDDARDAGSHYPVDEDGSVWYPDVSALDEALKSFRDDARHEESE